MAFDYLERTKPHADGEARRVRVHTAELAHRAALLYRLGFTAEAATARLAARTAWEFDPPAAGKHGFHHRPAALSDGAIAKIVTDTFARRPGT